MNPTTGRKRMTDRRMESQESLSVHWKKEKVMIGKATMSV